MLFYLVIMSYIYINIQKLKIKDMHEVLKFLYHIDTDALNVALMDNGVIIEDESDLMDLAELSRSGGDVNGALKDNVGAPVFFNLVDIIKSMSISKDKLLVSKIKFTGYE